MKKVSVIIPNYNHADYLQQRIDSVLEQTFLDFEVIILDDCSSDHSMEVIEKYRDHPKISHIVYNKENSGSTFKQWKKGIDLAKGKWIWIAESDDYCKENFLENVLDAIDNSDAVLGFSLSEEVDLNNKTIRKRPLSIEHNVAHGKDYILSNLIYQNDIYNASMVLFNKEYIDQNIYKKLTNYKYAGDWLFFGDIIKKGCVIEVHEYLNYFRRHNNNVSNPSMKKGLSFLEGLEAVLELKKGFGIRKINFLKKWISKWKVFNDNFRFSAKTNLLIFIKIIKTVLHP
ncbi:glycosyltransferase [Epilithonimonas ginsengisoli]|uniref:Glycosyltransferase n=1 Tax=Epilithonimonas ginsengisoli TaxID=1245592 RepID=A0ABU4JIM6_9FLAO|nr:MULTISPECIES: glycosyltransferase [Chryseobacterium group]MBV6879087.1 glycosyltransferase [Epilithonimonas sp. FP105]MDW8549521.1 glycosyltransferase [Epilithonimonas ginsengisoli]